MAEGYLKGDAPQELSDAADGLVWLSARGALAGVAEIIRERRRQIGRGWTREHDDEAHGDGFLALMAAAASGLVDRNRREGLADPAADEELLRKTGALAAAEIDRLARAFTPQEGK
jgi:hypothetical protein